MAELDQLRDDIATLPATAQQLVIDFVGFLKQRYASPQLPPLFASRLRQRTLCRHVER